MLVFGFYNDTQKLRVGNILANTAWAVYNIATGLYIVLIMRAITIISNIIAYEKRRNEITKALLKAYVQRKRKLKKA